MPDSEFVELGKIWHEHRAADGDELEARGALLEGADGGGAIEFGHVEIDDSQGYGLGLVGTKIDCLGAAEGFEDTITGAGKKLLAGGDEVGVVVNDQE